MKINWDTLAIIPPAAGRKIQHGLAGPVAGVYQDHLLIAGGTNFEDAMPWQGGTKLYHNDCYILTKKAENQLEWSQPEWKLPSPIAYSACISTGMGILSIGGESADGPVPRVFMLSVEGNNIRSVDLPDLPVALSSSCAAINGSRVYLAGGFGRGGATNHFLSLDLSAEELTWQTLPELPVPLSHAVAACQFDGKEVCIYVLGGRNKTGITSNFLSDIWKYIPSEQKWLKAGTLKVGDEPAFGLSAGTGLAFGEHAILLFGGDQGTIFNQTERLIDAVLKAATPEERDVFLKKKENNLTNHPGFSGDIYRFNTLTGKLSRLGQLPGMTQVTTNAFWWDQQIIIPGGEVRPGVRSAKITRGTILLGE